MSEQNFCKSCKKNLNKIEFILENKKYKTCNICRTQRSQKIKKNYCEECGIRASYNYEGIKFGIRCSEHKLVRMVDVKSKTCEHEGCRKQPVYNNEGESKGRFCVEHKLVLSLIHISEPTRPY